MRIREAALGASPREGAREVVRALLSEAGDAADRLARRSDDEALHDFRVALRRLRSALRAFRPWLKRDVERRHERKLAKVGRSTNVARDVEVLLAWARTERDTATSRRQGVALDLLVDRFEARAGGDLDPRIVERYRAAARRLRRRLRSRARGGEKGAPGETSFGAVLASLIGVGTRALLRRMDGIRGPADEEQAHRARIAAKRLRYLLEPLRGSRQADADEALRRLKRLQDVLGELHDRHVLAGELREALADAGAERARRIHAALYGGPAAEAALRHDMRGSPWAGLLAVARRVRDRRDALHAELDRERRTGGLDALAAEVQAVVTALGKRPQDAARVRKRATAAGSPSLRLEPAARARRRA